MPEHQRSTGAGERATAPDATTGADSDAARRVGRLHETTLARVARPSAAATTLAVVADPHVTAADEGTWKQYHHTEARLRATLRDVDERGVDGVVLLGDLTKDGTPWEFDRVDDLLRDLETPFVAVPGNHDVGKAWNGHRELPLVDFVDRYTAGALPFVERVGGVDLVGLNTASLPGGSLRETNAGAVSAAQLDWLDRTLPALETPVVALHHTLARPADRTDRLPDDEHHHLRNADELRSLLERHGVGLVLSGHLHWPSVGRVGTVRELVAPSTCSYPPSYLLLSVDPRGVIARMVPVAGVEGTAAAFRAATRASDRPRTLAESVVEGYFDRFPLLDDRPAERLAGRP